MPDYDLAIPLDPNRDHGLGKWNAAVQLVEYGDYECPSCRRAYPLLERLKEEFGERLLFVFRHFPIFTMHRHASAAAQAAEAAADQGKFWEMHDLLYLEQRLEPPDLTHYALKIGLEVYRFDAALAAGTYFKRVESDFQGGQRSGVTGTPTLFINGIRYDGPVEEDALLAAITLAMEGQP